MELKKTPKNAECNDDTIIPSDLAIINALTNSSTIKREYKKTPKNAEMFSCEDCHFVCSKKSDWSRHISRPKHMRNCHTEKKTPTDISAKYICESCNKIYKHASGLWKHSKICTIDKKDNNTIQSILSDNEQFKQIILQVVKSNTELQKQHNEIQLQNSELQKQMLEVCKNSNITNNINTNNSHNKTFNLQFFLNEQCKDAMNISDFVNSFDLQLSDLESVGELGYVEGMTKIFLDKLNSMDIYKRPIHCSDTKREILYVKDEDKWEKEKRNNPKLRDAIKHLSFKNMKLTNLWSNTYPESKNNESRLNDVYMKLVLQSTGGSGEIVESENKIIRRIAKEIFIDKNSIIL